MYESNMTIPSNTTATGYGYAGSLPASPDVSPVSQQTTLIQKLLAENREMQSVLNQRLHAVLRPVAPEAGSTVGEAQPGRAPLTDDLWSFAVSLQHLLSGYNDIINRLEL